MRGLSQMERASVVQLYMRQGITFRLHFGGEKTDPGGCFSGPEGTVSQTQPTRRAKCKGHDALELDMARALNRLNLISTSSVNR
jgi:hypothetical protein